jgi:PEP-CTERM/exosortase A-associated glycosyltransferase
MSAFPLKILHILDHSLPLHSGYTFRSHSILRAQVKFGWKPIALTSPKHEASWRHACDPVESVDQIRYYRTGASKQGKAPFEGEIRLMVKLSRRIETVAREEKPDLLHAHSPWLNAIPALRVGRKLKIPVVYEIRAFWEDAAVDHRTYSEGSLKYRFVKRTETWVCRQVDQLAVLCQGVRQDIISRAIPEEKVTVVYNGIDLDDFTPSEPDSEYGQQWKLRGKRVIGFIGSFYRYEGLDLLIDAFALLTKDRQDLVLLLVGGGETELELRGQIERLGLQQKVLLPGRISHDRIPGVYALIDVLCYPRYSMRLTELVTPLKPLECMAMRKPLVASNIGGHRELITDGQTGILFAPGDTLALTAALKKVLDDPELKSRLENKGFEWVRQNHPWEKTASAYLSVYSKALRRKVYID